MKRALAWLLCGLLLLGACTASAASPQDVFARGHALEWALTLNPDADALLALLQGDTPLSNELPEAFAQEASEPLKTLAKGIADLRLGGSFMPWALSLSLGTDQGGIASASLWADAKTGGNGLTTDLLDCLFFLPQDKVKPVLEQANRFLPLDIPGLISPYLILLRDGANELLDGKAAERGSYIMGELGEFDKKVSTIITTHDAARMLRPLLAAFEGDFALQTAISQIVHISKLLQDDPLAQGSVNAEISRGLKNFIAETLSQEEEDLLELSAYGREGLDSLCYVIDTARVQENVALRLAILPGEKQGGLILTAGDGYKLDGAGTPQGVDWEKVRAQAMEGSGQPMEESAHLALQYATAEGEPLALSLWAYSAGIPLFGVTAEHQAQESQPNLSETTAKLSVFGKEPVLSLTFTLQETDALPALPDTNNWPVLSLTDDDLENKVDIGNLPTLLLRRFSMAFPDTAEELIKAVQAFDQ
jgi:hypothetical protein